MEKPLPAFSMLPTVQHATAVGRAQRDAEIERLLRCALEELEERLADAGGQYLLPSPHDHPTRTGHAARAWLPSGVISTFRRIRDDKLEPLLARALLNLTERAQHRDDGPVEDSATGFEEEPPDGELFVACPEGKIFKEGELQAIASRRASVWWHEASSRWFGSYFAFWYKDQTRPSENVTYVLDQGSYGSRRFGKRASFDGDKDKLTVVSASWFNSDTEVDKLYCGLTNYGFAFEWAKDHADELLSGSPPPSVFGATDRPAYPGIAGVHTLIETSDGYLVFGLRGLTTVTYHQLTWSASFEESILPDLAGKKGDKTVFDTIVRGLREEWGIPGSAIAASTTLALGREFVRINRERLDLSFSILATVRLSVNLQAVWQYLNRRVSIIDIDEHCAWVAVCFRSRADLLQLLRFARGRTSGYDLFSEFADSHPSAGEVVFYPGGPSTGIEDRGLMPTSAARLYLGSRWLRL
jgi:hypothetical protein